MARVRSMAARGARCVAESETWPRERRNPDEENHLTLSRDSRVWHLTLSLPTGPRQNLYECSNGEPTVPRGYVNGSFGSIEGNWYVANRSSFGLRARTCTRQRAHVVEAPSRATFQRQPAALTFNARPLQVCHCR